MKVNLELDVNPTDVIRSVLFYIGDSIELEELKPISEEDLMYAIKDELNRVYDVTAEISSAEVEPIKQKLIRYLEDSIKQLRS